MSAAARPVERAAHGSWIETTDGRRVLNCGGYGVLTFGAGHPTVVAAVHSQLDRLAVGSRSLEHDGAAPAADALRTLLPGDLTEVAFGTTGSEAVEMALRLARLNRAVRVVTTAGGFHGRTLGALSVNGSDRLRRPYRPLLDGVAVVPYDDVDAVAEAVTSGEGRAAVILEPVQGEAGVIVPSPDYVARVAQVCREHDALLIADEVQTGLGRLGHLWGVDRSDAVPDILVMGKALGGGVLPVSGVAASSEVFSPFRRDPRQASATFSGFPLAAAAVRATVDVVGAESVAKRAAELEPQIAAILAAVPDALGDRVRDVRGLGVLHGVEFAHPRDATAFSDALIERDVVPSYSLAATAAVRLTPSALTTPDELDHLRAAVTGAAAALAA